MKARIMMGKWMMMMRTCFTVSKGGTKESRGIAAKSKKVEDHCCHRVGLFFVVRIVRLEKNQNRFWLLGSSEQAMYTREAFWTKLVLILYFFQPIFFLPFYTQDGISETTQRCIAEFYNVTLSR